MEDRYFDAIMWIAKSVPGALVAVLALICWPGIGLLVPVVRGLPGWRPMMVKGEQAIGYEWFGYRSRYDAGRKLLRALQAWDAEHDL